MADVTSLIQKVEASARMRVALASKFVLEDRQARAPYKTGALRNSGKVGPVRRVGDSFSCTIEFTDEKAAWFEKGISAHTIRSRGVHPMFFYAAGEAVAALEINHPGVKKYRGWFTNGLGPVWNRSLRLSNVVV